LLFANLQAVRQQDCYRLRTFPTIFHLVSPSVHPDFSCRFLCFWLP